MLSLYIVSMVVCAIGAANVGAYTHNINAGVAAFMLPISIIIAIMAHAATRR